MIRQFPGISTPRCKGGAEGIASARRPIPPHPPFAKGGKSGEGQCGFSLLEILVAFSIMALSLGVLLRIFGGAGQIAGTADRYSRAIVVAESLLATAGVETPLEPGETHGQIDDEYRWSINVRPYPMDAGRLGPNQGLGFKPYWVELSVEWGDPSDPRAFDLITLRLLPDKNPGGGL